MIKTLEWTNQGVRFIDQTRLPTEEVYVTCSTHQEVATAIRDLVVRVAPAIGVHESMCSALGVRHYRSLLLSSSPSHLVPYIPSLCSNTTTHHTPTHPFHRTSTY